MTWMRTVPILISSPWARGAWGKARRPANVTNFDRHLAGRLESRSLNSTRSEAPRGSDEDRRMKIKVLGSYGSEGQGQRPSALLVDDRVLVDAGTVGGALTAAEQIDVEYALISHAHFDHIAGLCF